MIPQLCWSGIQRAQVRNRWKFKSTTQMERWLRRRKWPDLGNTRIKSTANLTSVLASPSLGHLLVRWWQRLPCIIHVCFSEYGIYPIYYLCKDKLSKDLVLKTPISCIRFHFSLFVASCKKRLTLTIPKMRENKSFWHVSKVWDQLPKPESRSY